MRTSILVTVVLTGCTALGKLGSGHAFVDQPPASPIAASSAGTIQFSTQPIPRGPADASAFATAFDLDHPMYWRAFFKRSAANSIKDAGKACKGTQNEITLDVRDAGAGDDAWYVLTNSQDYKFGDSFLTWTTMSTTPGRLLDHGDKDHSEEELGWVARHPRGPLPIEVRFTARCDGASSGSTIVEMARGKLTLAISDATLASYVKLNHLELTGVTFADATQFHKIDAEVHHLFTGKTLSSIFVVDNDWGVDRGALDVPVRRWARGVAVVHEDTGGCTRYNFMAIEDALGGGKFVTTPRIESSSGHGLGIDLKGGGDAIACQQVAGELVGRN